MKYIDADKLKAEIDKRYQEYRTKSKGDKYYEGMADSLDYFEQFIDSLQQEKSEEICSKCTYYGKDDGYCYNPHDGGMQSSINENGVYECTGFCEKEQEQPEVDLEKELQMFLCNYDYEFDDDAPACDIARHFYELGLNARKEE